MTLFQEISRGGIAQPLTADDLFALTEAGVIGENEKLELIEGEVVPTAAAKASLHETMKSQLIRALARGLPDPTRLFAEPSVVLAPNTLVEPDLAVWAAGGLSREVRGPDLMLMIEVADSSIGYDLRVKAPLYARAGVRDYWVVDCVRRTIRVHRDPGDGRYRTVSEHEAHEGVTPLVGAPVIRLDVLD